MDILIVTYLFHILSLLGGINMVKHLLCTNCGYDMVGSEYIANTVDSSLAIDGPMYSNSTLLDLNTRPYHQIVCPYCKSVGNWTT